MISNAAEDCFIGIKQFRRGRYVFQKMLFQKIKPKAYNRVFRKTMYRIVLLWYILFSSSLLDLMLI